MLRHPSRSVYLTRSPPLLLNVSMTARPAQPLRYALPTAPARLTSHNEIVHHRPAPGTGGGDGGVLREGHSSRIVWIPSILIVFTPIQVLGLLDRLSGTVSPSFFLQNVWLIMLTSPPNRGTALNYLARRLPRITPEEGAQEPLPRVNHANITQSQMLAISLAEMLDS